MDAPMDEAAGSGDSVCMARPPLESNPPFQRAVAEALSHLQPLQTNGVGAVLIDHGGQPIGAIGPMMPNPEAIGALGNGLLSVSDSLVRQLGGSWAGHVVVTSDDRQTVVLPVSFGVVAALVIVAPHQMPLGPLLWAARRCCADLGKAAGTPSAGFSDDLA